MHGHVVPISHSELAQLDKARETGVDNSDPKSLVTIQLALLNQDTSLPSIVVVDRIRLATLTFLKPNVTQDGQPIWWASQQGPCPITQPEEFASHFDKIKIKPHSQSSIFYLITKHQQSFNGIGTSHANEILHLAMEHPAQKASIILSDPSRRERLKKAILDFFAFAFSTRYQNAVSSNRSGGSAFSEPSYITRNIISLQQRVYGHTKAPTKISKEHYTFLFEKGLLDPSFEALGTPQRNRKERNSQQKSKMVPVYAIRFLNKSNKGEIKQGSFAYTVMYEAPSDSVAVQYQSEQVSRRQALGNRQAEIGIASFTDHAPAREIEKHAFRRRWKVKSGRRGRPRKSKNHKVESAATTSSILGKRSFGQSLAETDSTEEDDDEEDEDEDVEDGEDVLALLDQAVEEDEDDEDDEDEDDEEMVVEDDSVLASSTQLNQ